MRFVNGSAGRCVLCPAEVSAAVAQMTWGRPVGPRSSGIRGAEDLLWSHDSHRPGTEDSCGSSDPETLLKGFAGDKEERLNVNR